MPNLWDMASCGEKLSTSHVFQVGIQHDVRKLSMSAPSRYKGNEEFLYRSICQKFATESTCSFGFSYMEPQVRCGHLATSSAQVHHVQPHIHGT